MRKSMVLRTSLAANNNTKWARACTLAKIKYAPQEPNKYAYKTKSERKKLSTYVRKHTHKSKQSFTHACPHTPHSHAHTISVRKKNKQSTHIQNKNAHTNKTRTQKKTILHCKCNGRICCRLSHRSHSIAQQPAAVSIQNPGNVIRKTCIVQAKVNTNTSTNMFSIRTNTTNIIFMRVCVYRPLPNYRRP